MPRCDATGAAAATLCCIALGAAVYAPPATAQLQRKFPAQALRGEMAFTQPPEVLLNRKPARLAPGARIRDTNNLMIVSGAAAGRWARVNYTLDASGELAEVWLLTPDEAARQPWPTTRAQAATWRFDWTAQTWTRP